MVLSFRQTAWLTVISGILPETSSDGIPSLVVGLRVDESASMAAFGRLEAAKRAVIAVYEFCQICHIPVLIYGDTADVSRMEQMSIFAYADYDQPDVRDRFRLMGIRARSNNRDGMALNYGGTVSKFTETNEAVD